MYHAVHPTRGVHAGYDCNGCVRVGETVAVHPWLSLASCTLRTTTHHTKSNFENETRASVGMHPPSLLFPRRTLGSLPGVRVSEAISPITLAPLLADRHCGEGTELIFYMNPGELLSRKFTSKDTHSAAGDLLVMYAEVCVRLAGSPLARFVVGVLAVEQRGRGGEGRGEERRKLNRMLRFVGCLDGWLRGSVRRN